MYILFRTAFSETLHHAGALRRWCAAAKAKAAGRTASSSGWRTTSCTWWRTAVPTWWWIAYTHKHEQQQHN